MVPSFLFFFYFFVLYFCLLHLLRGGMKAIPLCHRCRQSAKEVAFPPPPSSGTFSHDVFVFLLQRLFRFVWFPLLFVLVFVRCCPCGGRVAMLAVWTHLPPKDRKEVTDRVAMLTVAFGTCRLLHRVLLWSALLSVCLAIRFVFSNCLRFGVHSLPSLRIYLASGSRYFSSAL